MGSSGLASFTQPNASETCLGCCVNQSLVRFHCPVVLHGTQTARFYGRSMFNFIRNCKTVFQSGCAILNSHQQCMRVPVNTHPRQSLELSVLCVFNVLIGVQWYLMVLICISLMTNDGSYVTLSSVHLW